MITGLHTCKPTNEPKVGMVKRFTVLDMGNWTKIKSAKPDDMDGENFKIVSVEQSRVDGKPYKDQYGNVSFNLGSSASTLRKWRSG